MLWYVLAASTEVTFGHIECNCYTDNFQTASIDDNNNSGNIIKNIYAEDGRSDVLYEELPAVPLQVSPADYCRTVNMGDYPSDGGNENEYTDNDSTNGTLYEELPVFPSEIPPPDESALYEELVHFQTSSVVAGGDDEMYEEPLPLPRGMSKRENEAPNCYYSTLQHLELQPSELQENASLSDSPLYSEITTITTMTEIEHDKTN